MDIYIYTEEIIEIPTDTEKLTRYIKVLGVSYDPTIPYLGGDGCGFIFSPPPPSPQHTHVEKTAASLKHVKIEASIDPIEHTRQK